MARKIPEAGYSIAGQPGSDPDDEDETAEYTEEEKPETKPSGAPNTGKPEKGRLGDKFDADEDLEEDAEEGMKAPTKSREGEVLSATTYYEKGNNYYEQGDYDRAIENYNMAIILNPQFLEAYFNRALCYYNKKNYDKAIEDYTHAIDIDPDNPLIYNNRGDAYYRKQDFEKAIADYDKAISLNPEYLKAHYNRGLAYACLQDYESAVDNFTKVTEIDPNFAEAYNARGLAYEYMENFDEAEKDYNKALELNPNFSEAKDHLAALKKKKSEKEAGEGVSGVKFLEKPKTTFKDVVGMEKVKEQIKEYIVYPLQDPELARKYGKMGGGGVLMYGPPGCGKTFIMKSAAGECNANFLNVKLSDVLDMYVGNTEKNIRNLFEAARKNAPAIMFIDEIDGLGGRRDQMKESAQYMKMAVNQLLYEMDGIEARNENLLVVAATNAPWDVDPALRRAGRFTKLIYIGEPDYKARVDMFKYHSKKFPTAKNINWGRLARATAGYAASDIKAICDEAASIPWLEAHRDKKPQREVRMSDFLTAIKKTRSSLPAWYDSAKKEVGKQEEIEYVDGKQYKRIKEPKMSPGERQYFRQLVELIEKRNKWYNKAWLAFMKIEALYEEWFIAAFVMIIAFILWTIYGPQYFPGFFV
ncbi:MAG: tetratricopeptide repeat protein [Candidatus Micrarchaeia archaeon]